MTTSLVATLALLSDVPPTVYVLTGLGIVLVFVLEKHRRQRASARSRALRKLAAGLGWRYDAEIDYGHEVEFDVFPLFSTGSNREGYHSMHGTLELRGVRCPAKMGDFRYVQRVPEDVVHRFSYLVVHLPFDTPALTIRRERVADSVGRLFAAGVEDIEFEWVEFNREFHVTSSDKKFAFDICTPAVMELLMVNKPPMIDVAAGLLCLSNGYGTWSGKRFRQALAFVQALVDAWPEHATQRPLPRRR